ncbi:serine hydrolase domain-containing protein, partial [Xanthovirga aplysinae]|uniref:serine hydrolase domain-containing protein n=1 Tax=Xanthovirga aplysinae TaxID=2529853 RepID=UPI0012BC7EDE
MRKLKTCLIFILLTIAQLVIAKENKENSNDIPELQTKIEQILKNRKIPAIGIALLMPDGQEWVTSIGYKSLEDSIAANENTMFRIGSTAKMFVSLAILKLQDEGKINLNDKIRKHIPEISFQNKWEKTDPVIIAHLLEHTTGWDDLHGIEYTHNQSDPISLKNALDLHPHSRTSRWVPGTRVAYSNSGPAVAAYIVEKITNMPFEKYVQENFFKPLNMTTATYFNSEVYKKHGASLYVNNVKQDYWNLIMRPSGAINASPVDMINMLKFFTLRTDSTNIISPEAFKRMETAMTSTGAKTGLEMGYGLSNYIKNNGLILFRGHDGEVFGGQTDFSYSKEHQMGYAIMINNDNGIALKRIGNEIKKFLSKKVHKKTLKYSLKTPTINEGYYVPISPPRNWAQFLLNIGQIHDLRIENDTINFGPIIQKIGRMQKFIFDGKGIKALKQDKIALIESNDPLEGKIIQTGLSFGTGQTFKPISGMLVFTRLLLTISWVNLTIITIFIALIWIIKLLLRRLNPDQIRIRIWSISPSIIMVIHILCWVAIKKQSIETLGSINTYTISIMISGILFALSVVLSGIIVYIDFKKINHSKFLCFYLLTLYIFNSIITIYLF